jgi:transcriptional regulator with PAS, ATPase and Fis domain
VRCAALPENLLEAELFGPLRSRPDDIAVLVEHFMPARTVAGLDADQVRTLSARPWLGNVRELRNFVERALALGTTEALAMTAVASADASRGIASPAVSFEGGEALPTVPSDRPFKELRERWVDHLEREYLRQLLERYDRNVRSVAQAAGLDHTYVYRLLKKHAL